MGFVYAGLGLGALIVLVAVLKKPKKQEESLADVAHGATIGPSATISPGSPGWRRYSRANKRP